MNQWLGMFIEYHAPILLMKVYVMHQLVSHLWSQEWFLVSIAGARIYNLVGKEEIFSVDLCHHNSGESWALR